MHPNLEMNISIEYQLRRLGKKYKAAIASLTKAENDFPKLFEAIIGIQFKKRELKNHYNVPRDHEILPIYFSLIGNYRLAWLTRIFLGEDWRRYEAYTVETYPIALDEEYLFDLKLLWQYFDTKKYAGLYRGPGNLGAIVSPSCEAVNEEMLNRILGRFKKHFEYYSKDGPDPDWGADPELLYNPLPKARYVKCAETPEFHLSYDSLSDDVFDYIVALLANEKNLEAAEWLFRIRHILSRSCPPKGYEYAPKLIQIASRANCLDCWFLARLSQDPAQRRTLGWMSIYWLLENVIVSLGPINSFPYPFTMLCGLLAEFELLGGDEQAKFQRHLKLFISFGSKSLARKMLEDPTPMMGLKEMGGIPGPEALAIYLRLVDERKKNAEKKEGK